MRTVVHGPRRCMHPGFVHHVPPLPHRHVATAAASSDGPRPRAPAPWQQRSEVIMGADALVRLANASATVVGLGGVGSWAAEMLCRAGVGKLVLVDGDDIDSTNRNRQLPALSSTIGRDKVEVLAERMRDINPAVHVDARLQFLVPEEAEALVLQQRGGFLVDCIDSVAPKVHLIAAAVKHGAPIISAMGAGGKVDPARVQVVDISDTHNDRFARLVRKDLRSRGVYAGVPVVFSPELTAADSMRVVPREDASKFKRSFYGTMPYMPATFGMHVAAHVTSALSGYGALAAKAEPKRKSRKVRRREWSQRETNRAAYEDAATSSSEQEAESDAKGAVFRDESSNGAHADVDTFRQAERAAARQQEDASHESTQSSAAEDAHSPSLEEIRAASLYEAGRIRGAGRPPPIPPGLLFDI